MLDGLRKAESDHREVVREQAMGREGVQISPKMENRNLKPCGHSPSTELES